MSLACKDKKIRWTLKSILLTITIAAFYSAVGAAVFSGSETLLAPNQFGEGFALVCSGFALIGFSLLVLGLVRSQGRSPAKIGLVIAAGTYIGAVVGSFLVLNALGMSEILNRRLSILIAFTTPCCLISLAMVVHHLGRGTSYRDLISFFLSVGCVGFLHLWIVVPACR